MKIRFLRAHPMFECILVLLLSAAMVLSGHNPARAQSAGEIIVASPDTGAFPVISTSFRAFDAEGAFIKDLRPIELRLLENDTPITGYNLEMIQTGVRFYVAVNEGPTLANRYSGVARFDRIKTALFNWISSRPPDTMDEFNLVTSSGLLPLASSTPESWQSVLDSYQPDLRNAVPGPASLSNAVDSAISIDQQTEKSSAILYITPLPTAAQFAGIQEIINRAGSNGVRVYIWLIGPQDYAASEDTRRLSEFAVQTGGELLLFSGSETLPDLAPWLDQLSYIYHLSYTSQADASDDYSMSLKIERGSTIIESTPVTYSLTITPPNPIFLSPPVEITRSWTDTVPKKEATLAPDQTRVEIIIEFPDGLPREIVTTRLYVDDNLAAENNAPPFDIFTWDISGYVITAPHTLRAEAVDIIGLIGETIEIPVDVIIQDPPKPTFKDLFKGIDLVKGVAIGIILLAAVLLAILLTRILRRRFKRRAATRKVDPVTQAVEINGEYSLEPEKPEEVVKWPVIRGIGLAPARLVQKRSTDQALVYPVEIPLGSDEMIIGSDSKKSDFILTHATISARHARIFKDADGNYRLADAGSSAGTWVNYAPISNQGIRLEHGDLVQFGRLAYTFELHGAVPRRVQLLPHKED